MKSNHHPLKYSMLLKKILVVATLILSMVTVSYSQAMQQGPMCAARCKCQPASIVCFGVSANDVDFLSTRRSGSAGAMASSRLASYSAVETLRLTRAGGLSTLAADQFRRIAELVTLDIELSAVEAVDARAFDGLTLLRRLRLVGNPLHALDDAVFRPLAQLEHLDLSTNALTTEGLADDFLLYNARLRTLVLAQNQLHAISTAWFRNLVQLETLDLSRNRIREIVAYKIPERELQMGAMRDGDDRKDRYFPNTLPSLRILSLKGNIELRRVESNSLSNLTALEAIDFSDCSLSYLDPAVFERLHRLTKLRLDGNLWYCDCSILPLVRYINAGRHALETTTSRAAGTVADMGRVLEPACVSPNAFHGVSLLSRNLEPLFCPPTTSTTTTTTTTAPPTSVGGADTPTARAGIRYDITDNTLVIVIVTALATLLIILLFGLACACRRRRHSPDSPHHLKSSDGDTVEPLPGADYADAFRVKGKAAGVFHTNLRPNYGAQGIYLKAEKAAHVSRQLYFDNHSARDQTQHTTSTSTASPSASTTEEENCCSSSQSSHTKQTSGTQPQQQQPQPQLLEQQQRLHRPAVPPRYHTQTHSAVLVNSPHRRFSLNVPLPGDQGYRPSQHLAHNSRFFDSTPPVGVAESDTNKGDGGTPLPTANILISSMHSGQTPPHQRIESVV